MTEDCFISAIHSYQHLLKPSSANAIYYEDQINLGQYKKRFPQT